MDLLPPLARKKILVTGFEPFATFSVNPSGLAADRIARQYGSIAVATILRVDFYEARRQLLHLLNVHKPEICLCTGLAPGNDFRLERTARKVRQFSGLPGSETYSGTLQFQMLHQLFRKHGAPVRYSDDCGQFVCESTYWTALDHFARSGPASQCGFLHVPSVSEASPLARTMDLVDHVVQSLLRDSID